MARSTIGIHQEYQTRGRFGQNFLADNGVVRAIVAAIGPKPDDVLVEIDPGLDALTVPPMKRVCALQVAELDRNLVVYLQQQFGDRLTVYAGDALAFDSGSLQEVGQSLRIVSNPPYNISSPLLFHLATFADCMRDQHFTLQKEVVDRTVITPGSKVFSRLSMMLRVRYYMELAPGVSPGSFNPPPKVDSTMVRMIPWSVNKSPYVPVDLCVLDTVVAMAFSQRHKVLRNTLGALRDVAGFEALGFDLGRRAEEASVEDFVAVANTLSTNRIAGSAFDLSED